MKLYKCPWGGECDVAGGELLTLNFFKFIFLSIQFLTINFCDIFATFCHLKHHCQTPKFSRQTTAAAAVVWTNACGWA